MHMPRFWKNSSGVATLLQPMAALYQWGAQARQSLSNTYHSVLPVMCVGNVVAGGAGKTPTVLMLAEMLKDLGVTPHILSRGYGGSLRGPLAVDTALHSACEVGDEPLLLARAAPIWIARDRRAGLQALEQAGASCVLMDDGLQNPSIAKTMSLLVVDGGYGMGNGRCLPAGPLREPWENALARVAAVLIIGDDLHGVSQRASGVPVLKGTLAPSSEMPELAGQRWMAFAGIGRPAKFFETLVAQGADIVASVSFPDHHPYCETELQSLAAQAENIGARLITTEKDAVRLPSVWREQVAVLPVRLVLEQTAQDWLRASLKEWSAAE
jgi:tetraacyldisaccharide 4'-kinase